MTREDALQAELARVRAELLALLAVNQTLRVSRDLATVYRVVGSQLANVITFDSFFIGTYLPETKQVRYEYSMDEGVIDDKIVTRSLEQARLSAAIIRERRPLRIDDLDREMTQQGIVTTPFGNVEKRSRSWLGTPMISGDEIQGVLAIQSYQPSAFTDADSELLLLLASQISVAVENARLVDRLKQTIADLSAPLIPVAEGVLVLPLIGTIDAERSERIIEQALDAVVARQADMLLIDVTGVTVVDGVVLDRLMKIIRAAQLLGARCSIVGISAALARMAVSLELDLYGLQTFSDLRSALAVILKVGD